MEMEVKKWSIKSLDYKSDIGIISEPIKITKITQFTKFD